MRDGGEDGGQGGNDAGGLIVLLALDQEQL